MRHPNYPQKGCGENEALADLEKLHVGFTILDSQMCPSNSTAQPFFFQSASVKYYCGKLDYEPR